jgi:phosphatidylserine decarboxylase
MMKQENEKKSLWDRVVVLPQYLIPHHAFSMMMYRLTRCEKVWFKNLFIRFIVKQYNVNVAEAEQTDLDAYPSFNAFFTRTLRAGVHQIAQGQDVAVSPVDGAISQIGAIEQGQIIQAKGHSYSVASLLGGNEALAEQFEGGQFTTIYLSPKDYHRIHMPLDGQLKQMTYIPGKLFSVSPRTARTVPDLFARNERVVTVFETEIGPLVVVLVGAIFVGSMETVWAGQITPPYGKDIQHWTYDDDKLTLNKGEELGRFNMGSTIVMLLPRDAKAFLSEWAANSPIRLGQAMN